MKLALSTTLFLAISLLCFAEEEKAAAPAELAFIKSSIGTWDAEIVVWPQGPDAPTITFKGVETNKAFGEHWLASDFVSEYQGEPMKVHTLLGYDLDKKSLVGTIVDHGPYAATMTGNYDSKTKSVKWLTKAKFPDGKPLIQHTTVTHTDANKRLLVMEMGGKKYMEIRYTKRK